MYRNNDTQLDLGSCGVGEWLGLPECLISGPSLYDAIALPSRSASTFVFLLSKVALNRLLALDGCRDWLAEHLARQHYSLYARVELSSPAQRLVQYLLDHSSPNSPRLDMTQEALAEVVSCSRESVNRILSRLQLEGCVRLGRGYVEVKHEQLQQQLQDPK